jgi:hypothetical protein
VTADPRLRGRLQLVLVAAAFLGPLLVAAWLYYRGTPLQPEGRTNHGTLLQPVTGLHDALPATTLFDRAGKTWVLLYANDGPCEVACRDALYTLHQSRLMLGKNMQRLTRVFLHGNTPPDTVFLAQEHPGLVAFEDGELYELLRDREPADLPDGGYFLIDPLGNLVMYFRPDIDPSDMVDDIQHLLLLSQIG